MGKRLLTTSHTRVIFLELGLLRKEKKLGIICAFKVETEKKMLKMLQRLVGIKRLSDIERKDIRYAYCYGCDEFFVDDLPWGGPVICTQNGCGYVLERIGDIGKVMPFLKELNKQHPEKPKETDND